MCMKRKQKPGCQSKNYKLISQVLTVMSTHGTQFLSWTGHPSYPLYRWARPQWGSPFSWWCCTCWTDDAPLSAVCDPLSRWETSPSSSRHLEIVAHPRAWLPACGTDCPVSAGRTATEQKSTLPRSATCSLPRTSHSYCPLYPPLPCGFRRQTLSLLLKEHFLSAPTHHPAERERGHWFNFRTRSFSILLYE